MNHPAPEIWVQFVYGETSAESTTNLEHHLKECPQCQEKVASFRSTMSQLNTWEMAPKCRKKTTFLPVIKWAAAACLLLFCGFCAGRITAKPDAAAIRAAIMPELEAQVKQEVAQMVRTQVAKVSAQTLTTAANNADKVAATYANAVYASLKKDVDTVALHADASLRKTAQQINQLADYQPTSFKQ